MTSFFEEVLPGKQGSGHKVNYLKSTFGKTSMSCPSQEFDTLSSTEVKPPPFLTVPCPSKLQLLPVPPPFTKIALTFSLTIPLSH